MAEGISRTILQYELDQQAAQRARAGVQSIGEVTDSVSARMQRLTIEADRAGQELVELSRRMATGELSGKEFDDAALKAARLREQIARINDEMQRTGQINITDQFDDISRRVSLAGDFQSNLGALRGLSGVAGLGGVGSGLDVAGEIVVLAEELPRLKAAAQGLPATLKEAASAIGGRGLGLIGAGAALAVAAKLLTDRYQEQARAVQELIDLRREETRRTLDNEEIIATRSSEANEQLIEQQRRLITETEREIEDFRAREEAARAEMLRLAPFAAAVIGLEEFQTAQAEAEKYNQAVQESTSAFVSASQELDNLVNVIGPGIAARESEEEAIERQRESIAHLIQSEKDRMAVEAQLNSAMGQTSEQIKSQIENAQEQRASLQASVDALKGVSDETDQLLPQLQEWQREINELAETERLLIEQVLPVVEAREREIQALKDQEAAQASLFDVGQRAVAIEQQGRDKIAQIAERGLEQIASAEQRLNSARTALVDFNTEQVERRAEIERQFMDSELDRTRKFRADLERLEEDSNRRLLQLTQQKEDAQFEATLQNDVGAFLRAQRQFDRSATEERGTFSREERRRIDDFNAESARQRQLLNQKLDALDKEAAKRREQLQQRIDEEAAAVETTKQQIRDKQQAEADAIRKSLNELVQGYDQSTKRMVATTQQGFNILENAGIDTINGILGALQRDANTFYSQAARQRDLIVSGYSGGSRVPTVSPGGGGFRPTAFAKGAYQVTQPTPAIIGDSGPGMAETIIPHPTGGLEKELIRLGLGGGGTSVTVNFGSIGGGITQADLDAVRREVATGVAVGLNSLRTGEPPRV